MRKLIEDHGALVATSAVAFAIGYSLVNCDLDSFLSGFASGAATLVAAVMWFED